jgi:hypothetical protein
LYSTQFSGGQWWATPSQLPQASCKVNILVVQ